MIAAAAQTKLHNSRAMRLSPESKTSLEFMGLVYNFAPGRHLLLAGLALAAAPVLYATLELPKWIVNGALQAGDFGCFGLDVGPPAALVMLTLAQFAALGTLAGLKYAGNVLSANLGERFLRAQRLRMLRNWRRGGRVGRGGALTPMLTQELEAVSGFAGAMVATPVAQGAALLTVLGFLLAQDWRLALAAVALTPLQALLAPRLMAPIGRLKSQRIGVVRAMCAGLAEPEADRIAPALVDARRAQDLRFEIHRRKFLMKTAHNMLGHMTPLLYLSVGGYLVIQGDLSLGALVAALAAYKEAAGPLRELFALYMRWSDARVRYSALRVAIR